MTGPAVEAPVRVFISYAHDDEAHEDQVRAFWWFLRQHGIDARLDLPAAERRQDWPLWMIREVRAARFVLVVASPAYRRRAEGDAAPDEGRGVQWEALLIREEVYSDLAAALERFLPVLLPGRRVEDIPVWLGPNSATHYRIPELTLAGAEKLLRLLLGQPSETEPPIGTPPVFGTRAAPATLAPVAAAVRTELLLDVELADGRLASTVSLAGTVVCRHEAAVRTEVRDVWSALGSSPPAARERMVDAGRKLAALLFDDRTHHLVADLADRLAPGSHLDLVLTGDGAALGLPVELLRLTTSHGVDLGPVGLRPGVSVCRRVGGAPLTAPVRWPGPIKVLAAVAAPDETRTTNQPLDVEAEMQAILDAVDGLHAGAGRPGGVTAEVQILEVASLAQISRALQDDAYHVLHLSAHGSRDQVELEDEDGGPAPATAQQVIDALRHAGRPVPLIVLSACSGGAAGAEAMAAGLIQRGADRVIAMQAPVTDS
ncbi:MAG TPA: CHAT domain-containing protein [Mycobacteriales bacterium]|nr:CHAT domain-containing protein [Mycobacteriales bacterium]